MSKKAPADAPEKTAKSSRVWPKLLLWSLVLAFGFLYLRSLDYPEQDHRQAATPKPTASPPRAASAPAPAQAPPPASPPATPAASWSPPSPAMAPGGTPGQTASSGSAPARRPASPQAASSQPAPARTTSSVATSGQPTDVSQGTIKAAESEAFAQGVMGDQTSRDGQAQASRAAASQGATQARSGATAPALSQPMAQPGYPQPRAHAYGQRQPSVAYPNQYVPNQYADYMRQQREAYEAARKRWQEAYGQYPQAPAQGGYPQGGYPGYYPPGYYQGNR